MVDTLQPDATTRPEALYRGLRMTADEYLALPEESLFRYELVDGVVHLVPSPDWGHQVVVTHLVAELTNFLHTQPLGAAVHSVDTKLRADLVYCPDLVYLRREKAARCRGAVTEIPDLVVEVISPVSRNYDRITKRGDYEAAGVSEYWLVDPERREFCFLVLEDGAYREKQPSGERYASAVLTGFELDLALIRRFF